MTCLGFQFTTKYNKYCLPSFITYRKHSLFAFSRLGPNFWTGFWKAAKLVCFIVSKGVYKIWLFASRGLHRHHIQCIQFVNIDQS